MLSPEHSCVSSTPRAGWLADKKTFQGIVTLVFFVTYIVFQPPSTIIVRAIGPRYHLASLTLLWGGLMVGMGFVKNWQQLAVCRVILGILEAGFFPSCVYLLSTWYTRCMLFCCSSCPSPEITSHS